MSSDHDLHYKGLRLDFRCGAQNTGSEAYLINIDFLGWYLQALNRGYFARKWYRRGGRQRLNWGGKP